MYCVQLYTVYLDTNYSLSPMSLLQLPQLLTQLAPGLSVWLLHWIEAFKFDARIRRTKLPIDRADLLVAMVLPALHLPTKFLDSGNVVSQALPRQHTEFNLRDVQPVREGLGLFPRKDFVERGGRVRIEVVHHDHHLARFRIVFFQHLLHEQRPIFLRAVLSYFEGAFACQRLIGNEQIGAAFFFITVVFPRNLSRLGRLRWILVLDEILPHLIHTDPGNGWVIGLAVHIEDILDVIDKVSVCFLWEASRLFKPRLELVFLSVVLTVSGLICST